MNKSLYRFILYFLIANIFLVLAYLPLMVKNARVPSNRFNPLVSTWAHDYYLYLSVITQGKNGFWLYHDPYTTEPTKSGIFYIFYIGAGKIASIFNLSSPVTYHLSSIISAELFIILTYVLASQIVGPKTGFWAGIMALSGTFAPLIFFEKTAAFPIGVNFDALERLIDIPHYIFGQAMLLASVISLIYFFRSSKLEYIIQTAIFSFIGGIILPSSLLPLIFALPLILIILYRNTYLGILNRKFVLNITSGIIITMLSSALAALLVKLQEKQGFPWNIWTDWNIARWNLYEPHFNSYLFLSFGILPILAIPSMIKFIKSKTIEKNYIVIWALLPYLLLPFVDLLQIPKIRLIQEAPFLPFAILASTTIFSTISFQRKNIFRLILIIFFLSTTLPVSLSLLTTRINQSRKESFSRSNNHIYIPNQEYSAISYIAQNLPINSIILANQRMGSIIPAFTPVVSFLGHQNQTKNFSQKLLETEAFYKDLQNEVQTKNFLITNKINYVYFGLDENELVSEKFSFSFLKPIFNNQNIILYQVNL
ncbi:hypothetical protein A2960_04090 [Candidatus Gottesmanbacteria bacterium RIFCSPLOWO2_01_FULL_39_12b]|uniref:Glycosyltransferase RgtA/B/C/D-like domain-containing protein n=1 Tax=Candidatus Gottesmanbacteria bacterium RIFCSPLOWO2_01_FULL_39_12b TaxID=1798388 RepID=A0A1F6AN85_9BACT|nr:MAG: hypothetical protein A2960_04090 [Candidatus Gottesmanbacteria bacterium RIFCSPLOWO2_01_FULL_39_12b]